MKLFIKRFVSRIFKALFNDLNMRRIKSSRPYLDLFNRDADRVNALQEQYPTLLRSQSSRDLLRTHERKVYSQFGEDGLLLHFFSLIGAPNKTFIEFGIEDGTECLAANLAINFGWQGLFIEGSPKQADLARQFYHQKKNIPANEVKIECSFLTVENINEVFTRNGFRGEIDLLSIDIDGVDYWIWQAVTAVRPRIVVIEYNASFGVSRSVTVPYHPAFDRFEKHSSGWYHGASLAALAHLAREKGYILAGCDSSGANAFFIRQDVAANKIPAMSVAEAFYPLVPRLREASQEAQFDRVKHLELVTIPQ